MQTKSFELSFSWGAPGFAVVVMATVWSSHCIYGNVGLTTSGHLKVPGNEQFTNSKFIVISLLYIFSHRNVKVKQVNITQNINDKQTNWTRKRPHLFRYRVLASILDWNQKASLRLFGPRLCTWYSSVVHYPADREGDSQIMMFDYYLVFIMTNSTVELVY